MREFPMRYVLGLTLFLLGLLVAPAIAQDKEITMLKAVLAEGPLDVTLFSDDFLKAVPMTQLEPIVADIKKTIGPVVAVEPKGGTSFLVETATHEMPSDLALDADGKIVGLFFRPPVAKNASIEEILSDLAAVAPETAYLVTKNGAALYARDAGKGLAVGSAFKLGVLKALRDEIDAGSRKWSDVVELNAADISLPSGMLQNWPVGSPLTLSTLASLMISISDNTATDALMHLVGRDKVEAALGVAPAITTRELFTLKTRRDLLARYQAGDVAARRVVLEEIAKLPVPESSVALAPHDQGAEWYVPPAKLCELIEAVADLGPMQINPGVANKADWARVAFKGGSEGGVLNLTTAVTAKDGTRYCVAASWNDPKSVSEAKATGPYASLLSKLAKL
jgi:beta-lactamase class A